jgi:hypothetical protein
MLDAITMFSLDDEDPYVLDRVMYMAAQKKTGDVVIQTAWLGHL